MQDVHDAHRADADHVREADFRVGLLAHACLPAKLARELHDLTLRRSDQSDGPWRSSLRTR